MSDIGPRTEQVLLDAACNAARFIETLHGLLGPARQLASHPQIGVAQAAHLGRLPMTALAIAHQQGLTQDAHCLDAIAALALEHRNGLTLYEQWLLLNDLETALQEHAVTHGTRLSQVGQLRQALEQESLIADLKPRDLRTLEHAPLEEKEACLHTLVNQPPPCGPFFMAQWAWAAQHCPEARLRPYILEGIAQCLMEASKGVEGNAAFHGAALFERFPEDLLCSAFKLMGSPDNAKLLHVQPLTGPCRALLQHYLNDEDISLLDRERMRAWHSIG